MFLRLFYTSFFLCTLLVSQSEARVCEAMLAEQISFKESLQYSGLSPLKMRAQFVGEERPEGVYIPAPMHMVGVVDKLLYKTNYLNLEELKSVQATIDSDGRLNSNFQAASYIFVVTLDGELRVLPTVFEEETPFYGDLKHSSLSQGEEVLMAGEFSLDPESQTLLLVNNKSDHYRPKEDYLLHFVEWIKKKTGRNLSYKAVTDF